MKKIIIFLAVLVFGFEIYSPAFKKMEMIPKKYTCDGENISIPIVIKDIPKNAESLALIMFDPDAPIGTFFHWSLYNIPLINKIPSNIPKIPVTKYGAQGINDFGYVGYGGPCPPANQTHRYFIYVYALDKKLNLQPKLLPAQIFDKIKNHIISKASYVGIYKRSGK